jgi:hypothetical protein
MEWFRLQERLPQWTHWQGIYIILCAVSILIGHRLTFYCSFVKVDLKCVSPTCGGYYYPDHLQLLGEM